jgi:hypothetical protein
MSCCQMYIFSGSTAVSLWVPWYLQSWKAQRFDCLCDVLTAFGKDIIDNISGEWRLVFTTGTKERQIKSGRRVNYFPFKAMQKFDASTIPMVIENGIYRPWDIPLTRFGGDFYYDARMRKLEFDFDTIELLGLLKIKLGRREIAKIGGATGLGSSNNEKLADAVRKAFFDWISADDEITTARGGGGGLALWKRVVY